MVPVPLHDIDPTESIGPGQVKLRLGIAGIALHNPGDRHERVTDNTPLVARSR